MKTNKILKISGALTCENQLEIHLQKIASNHNLTNKSNKETYPIPNMLENFKIIQEVYDLLNEHLKLGISIHPAGEWLLDNIYIIEETVKQIQKDMTLKKYTNFVGISNGQYKGFARIYVLASEIVAYTDNKIERKELEKYLESYQTKKTLSMGEIWNIGIFLQIAIIENIREICEKIYSSQIQKYRAENIVERLVENKEKSEIKFKNNSIWRFSKDISRDMREPFVEYMSYILKRYGKKGYSYLRVLEETVEMTGTTVSEVIKKEHFDIAVRKVSIGNSITSIKKIQRINFLEIFEKINGVEGILRKDPANVYEKMDSKTKEFYRNRIKEISKKTKISEIYIAKKIFELAQKSAEKQSIKGKDKQKESSIKEQYTQQEIDKNELRKKTHIGYYLIDKGINNLYNSIQYKPLININENTKVKVYIFLITVFSILTSILISKFINININDFKLYILSVVFLFIPSSEFIIQLTQYILGKFIKPNIIPKLNFINGIDEQNKTMVVIPTILKSKEKVKELTRKLEVYYLANKSKNIYFTLLGDCSESKNKEEEFDKEVISEGQKQIQKLNEKYKEDENDLPIFNFIYRKRVWNEKENSYLGWERKRGMLTEFNEYLLRKVENPFRINTIENSNQKEKTKEIKYIITLDADTDLILNSAFELIGAMAHILNEPIIDKEKNIVKSGYGIIQPRVGINLNISYKTLFTKIFAGSGGLDSYTNAISDIYQDNFKEGIFTGKGIYNLHVYEEILKNQIPENTVLSHDLLEGCYLRCGLASDILLMDGYPTKYNSFMNRLARWIRGDWQITEWLGKKSPLNLLSKYKILDNLRRSLLEISIIIAIVYVSIIEILYQKDLCKILIILLSILSFSYILEILNYLIFKKEGEQKQKTFSPKISGITGAFFRGIITLGCLPYKAYISAKAIIKTLYRKLITHKHLLEWTTSEEAERQAKSSLTAYYNLMSINVFVGIIAIGLGGLKGSLFSIILGIFWIITPSLMWYISREIKKKKAIEKLENKDRDYILEIGKKTWEFFKQYLNEENNYLITDNYQEDRKEKTVSRTSSTNIGLSLLAVISAYDLKYINIDECLTLLINIIKTIEELPKWNGHLYNWYNIKTKEPLIPRYISTVDSGNLVGYLYVAKSFLEEFTEENNEVKIYIEEIDKLIKDTNFSILYNQEQQIFSIGFNIEENKLTDSYYDLLASEARQASFIAISKKDVPAKHWNALSRTLTTLGKYKGLISWSGTAFEYLMPNINMPKYEGSLLDESCKFMIKSQMEYAKKLNIPWGISESAFNLKDLQSNYQYKAFGIPWLGLKRGLADEMVVSSYGGILAINEFPKEEIQNLKRLEQEGMYGKYGFYESIDYTPERVEKGKTSTVVKTYMAHHQGLILLSINNLFNQNILPQRFIKNPEIEATSILLQETMPETFIITKENKEKVEKLKYKDYENYTQRTYKKIDERLIAGNVISNNNYIIAMNQKGQGVSKYKDFYINRFKPTDDYSQGIFFTFKSIKNKKIWSSNYYWCNSKENQYQISFMPDKNEQEIINGNIKTKISTTIVSNEPVELRRIKIENFGNEEEILEVSSCFEPVLTRKEQDYAHPVFNNLFLVSEFDEKTSSLIIKRKDRENNNQNLFLAANLSTNDETIGDLEYEIDEEKFIRKGKFRYTKNNSKFCTIVKKNRISNRTNSSFKANSKNNAKTRGYFRLYYCS